MVIHDAKSADLIRDVPSEKTSTSPLEETR